MLLGNGERRENIAQDYNKKLQDLLLEFITEVIFVKQRQKNKGHHFSLNCSWRIKYFILKYAWHNA